MISPEVAEAQGFRRLRESLRAHGAGGDACAGNEGSALESLGVRVGADAAAEFLAAQLDAHGFDGLFDDAGVPLRAVAVRALLSLGYPYALWVDPADLAFARSARERRRGEEQKVR